MGWAERNNPKSSWNRKRNTTTFVKAPTPVQGEPTVIELSPKTIFMVLKDFVCRMLNLAPRRSQSHAPTS